MSFSYNFAERDSSICLQDTQDYARIHFRFPLLMNPTQTLSSPRGPIKAIA